MSGKRQKIQYSLALEPQGRGETPVSGLPRAEPLAAKPAPESPAVTEQLMEEVCDGENLQSAWKRVRRNQGSPGVDGMTIDDAKDYLREHWPSIRSQLYQPAKRVTHVKSAKPLTTLDSLIIQCVNVKADWYYSTEPTSPSRLSGSKYPSRAVGSEVFAHPPVRMSDGQDV